MPAVAAILVVAAVITGLIVLMFQPPSEADLCEKWNWDVSAAAQGYIHTRDGLSGPRYDTVLFRGEVQETRLQLGDVLAERPGEDCEIEEETQDLLEESEGAVTWHTPPVRLPPSSASAAVPASRSQWVPHAVAPCRSPT